MCTYCDVTPNIILNEAKYSWSQQLCILRIRSGWSYPAFDVANSPNICTKPSQASRNNGVSTPSSDIGTSANDYIDRPVGQFYCKWCLIPARRAGCRTLAVSKWGAIYRIRGWRVLGKDGWKGLLWDYICRLSRRMPQAMLQRQASLEAPFTTTCKNVFLKPSHKSNFQRCLRKTFKRNNGIGIAMYR